MNSRSSSGSRDRQSSQHQRIDHAEERRVRADAEGQRDHRDRGESPVAPQHAHRVAHVAPRVLDPAEGSSVAVLFFHLLYSTERAPCGESRLLGCRAAPHVLRGELVQVRAHFFVESGVQLPSQEQRANPRQQCPHQSFRSAATGLRRIARLAGIAEAIAVTLTRSSTVPTSVA